VFRRFDVIVPFEKPGEEALRELFSLRLGTFGLSDHQADEVAKVANGWSFADVARACDDAIRSMALEHRERVDEGDIVAALDDMTRRQPSKP
ncbi:MAG: ATPase, partial [Thermomicrobiales bacterium]